MKTVVVIKLKRLFEFRSLAFLSALDTFLWELPWSWFESIKTRSLSSNSIGTSPHSPPLNARSACDLLCECAFACLRSTLSNCRFLSNNSIVVTVPDEISRLNTSTHALHSLVMDYSWPIVIMLSDGSWGGGQRLIDYRVPAQPARPTIHSAL